MDPLSELSGALAGRVAAVSPWLVGLSVEGRAARSGFAWADGIVVTSEQGLPDGAAQAVQPGGGVAAAVPAGRDPGTNVAVFRVAAPAPGWPEAGEPAIGSLALLLGADGVGGPTARLGLVNAAGPAWTSMAGGRVDRLIRLDARLPNTEEGGPVLDAAGGLLGMSTLGPRRRAIVIPAATLARVVAALLATGRVPRGWLGVSLHPVAVPAALNAGAAAGLMVMSVMAGGPAEQAGLLPGDIILALDGVAADNARATTQALGASPVGSAVPLRLLRGGVVQTVSAVIGERPAC